MKQLKVICLCDNIVKALCFLSGLNNCDNFTFIVVVSNNQNMKSLFWMLRQLYLFLFNMGCKDKLLFIKSLITRRFLFSTKNLNQAKLYNKIGNLRPDVGLHAAGIIYKSGIISSFRLGILNAHIGILPKYRGRSVMEWSIFNGDKTGITTFFIDEGIDTGSEMILLNKFRVDDYKSVYDAKNFLFLKDIWCYKQALKVLRSNDYTPIRQNISDGNRYYQMSGLTKKVIDNFLQSKYEQEKWSQ